jgi:hypothetical protein
MSKTPVRTFESRDPMSLDTLARNTSRNIAQTYQLVDTDKHPIQYPEISERRFEIRDVSNGNVDKQ